MVPLSLPAIGKEDIDAVTKVLKSGWLAEGAANHEFEALFAKYVNAGYAVTLNSCASALFVAIKALGIRGEVILPSFTFVASANAIVTAGAKPVFADVLYDTGNIDPKDIERKITRRTEAIMPVHFAGQSADMGAIMRIAKKHKLAVIEDSAETIGGEYKHTKTGVIGTVGCFSFYPVKNITTGEGGMLTTNDPHVAQLARTYAGHGVSKTAFERTKSKFPWQRAAVLPGYNFRMSSIAAALGVTQMKKIDRLNALRRKHAAYLTRSLRGVSGIDLPIEEKNCKHVYQMYTIKAHTRRNELLSLLRAKGIGASVHFDPPVHLQPYYRKHVPVKEGSLPVTEKLSESIITLPLYPGMTTKNLDEVVRAVKGSVKEIL